MYWCIVTLLDTIKVLLLCVGIFKLPIKKEGIKYTSILYVLFAMFVMAVDYESTKGITEYLSNNTQNNIFEHICNNISSIYQFNAIVPTGWKTITLDGEIRSDSETDTDKDGISDWEEIDTEKISWDENGDIVLPTILDYINATDKSYAQNSFKRFGFGQWSDEYGTFIDLHLNYVMYNTHILPINSDPTEMDTDGDGLLDGSNIVINEGTENEKIVAPKDFDVMKYNGPRNLWKTHIEQVQSGEKLATGYSFDYYKIESIKAINYYLNGVLYKTDRNWKEMFMSIWSALGSELLGFRYDDKYIALHSDMIQWQAIGGYNDFYDDVFGFFTSMARVKIPFTFCEEEYVIWAWKGNYLNMGAGAEVGFYKKNNLLADITGFEQWNISHMFPMTLSLYKDTSDYTYSTYYNWVPHMEQWWITGFIPNPTDYSVIAEELYSIASVDFSKDKNLYYAFKYEFESEKQYENLKEAILDEGNYTIWLVW